MKIFIATQEEPFYLPTFFDTLVKLVGSDNIVGVNILPPFNTQKNWLEVVTDYFAFFGFAEFVRRGIVFVALKIADVLNLGKLTGGEYSVWRVFQKHNIPIYNIKKQNDPSFLNLVKCDIFVSVANPVIVKKDLINTPFMGCINFHAGYLPRYRGINPCFWSLLNGEKESAVTVHFIDEQIDNGPILGQKTFQIDNADSLHSLFLKVVEYGPPLLAEVIYNIENKSIELTENSARSATYFGFPKSEDGKRFRMMGLKFY
jgi:methionyl-tRNA formyltransferase